MNSKEYKSEYEEIDVLSYVQVIRKRKRIIFGFFLIAVIAAGVYSYFIALKIYKIKTILETPTDESIQLVEKIKNEVYRIPIQEKLKISEEEYPAIKTENPEGTNLATVEIDSAQAELAKTILEEMNVFILEESQERIKLQKKSIENDIIITENEIELIGKNIELTKEQVKIIKGDIQKIGNKIVYIEEERKNLESKIEALEEVLVYEQTPGTQFALFSAKEKLSEKKKDIEDLYLDISIFRKDESELEEKVGLHEENIKNLNIKIDYFKVLLTEITPIKIIKAPAIYENPIKPRPVLNIVISAALGIFLGVFLAFGKEWWEKAK